MRVSASIGENSSWRHAFPGDVLRLNAQCRIHWEKICVQRPTVPEVALFDRCRLQSKSAAVQGEKPFRDRSVRIRLLITEHEVSDVCDFM